MSTDAPRGSDRPASRPSGECAVETFTLGPFETNCYLVYERPAAGGAAGNPCWIVDAGFEPGVLIQRVRELALTPAAVLLTHAHVDHMAGVDEVLRAFPDTPVLIHPEEASWLGNPLSNLSAGIGMQITAQGPTGTLLDNQELTLGSSRWKVLHTPGHSPGGVSLVNLEQNVAIVGDALFAGSIGRTDFPGSDFDTLARSIRERLYTLPGEMRIYPGHGPSSTIGRERLSNPFVRGQ